jgi:hypothetical protein
MIKVNQNGLERSTLHKQIPIQDTGRCYALVGGSFLGAKMESLGKLGGCRLPTNGERRALPEVAPRATSPTRPREALPKKVRRE